MLGFIFELGILIAIYGFLWFFFELAIRLLSAGRKRSTLEVYSIKAIRYFFLVNVVFLFCLDVENSRLSETTIFSTAGLVLLVYFLGRFQSSRNRRMQFQVLRNGMNMSNNPIGNALNPTFNMKAEIIVISIAIACFVGFIFLPNLAYNPVSNWYAQNIKELNNTPIFGFIFKVVGFFFTVSLLFRMASGLTFLMSGGASQNRNKSNQNPRSEDDFTDYEEVD